MTKLKLNLVTFGLILGSVGILHGIAQLLKGSTPIESRTVEALPENWPNSEFYSMTKGSPVFSIFTGIPSYVLGVLAILISVATIVFSVTTIRRSSEKTGLKLFALLGMGIFLFGAGAGTPIFMTIPALITGYLSITRTKKKERSESKKRGFLSAFNFLYGLNIFSWILFFPGLFVLSFFGKIPPALYAFAFLSMPVGAWGALLFGYLYDKTGQSSESKSAT